MSALASLVELLHVEYGLDAARGGMAAAVARHIEDRVARLNINEDALFERVRANVEDERARLVHAVTVRHSWFYRDPDQLDALAQLLHARHLQAPERVLELWCAGCARGEEAWTLAMVAAKLELPVRVLATDVDAVAIDLARAGRYAAWSLRELPPGLQRYFQAEGEEPERRWVIDPSLRDKVEFAVHNLCDPAPARRFDLICCRNVLIYFGLGQAKSVVSRLRERLLPGGELALGSSDLLCGEVQPKPTRPTPKRPPPPPRSVLAPSTAVAAASSARARASRPLADAFVGGFTQGSERIEDNPLERAGLAVQSAEYEHGLQLATELTARQPLLTEAHLWAGLANYALGDYQAASEALRRARLLAPQLWPAILFAALTYERRGRWPAAQRCWLELERSMQLSDDIPIAGTTTLRGALSSWRSEALELARQRTSTKASSHPRLDRRNDP
ncbi:Chemotaxis protein methyltransferase CheR [Enhygromyxa salina]|uniref:Chemotaxis protein methyltransferase CheR n=1 Tax=Enhygromyxa salina TaxID=215803 RepID=A0A0C2CX89_9BACT|nr:CheR family methyltransferase [Enhygromyxa salina]KIG14215.1 Chemotaxis protein methyltransferase CheR [Enhygromyxa salina]